MPSPEMERMDALSAAIARLLKKQEESERRLEEVERALGIERAQMPVASAPPPLPLEPASEMPAPPPLPLEPAPAMPAPPPLPAIEPEPASREPQLETTFGLTWINRVAVVTLILFVAFVFKYAVDNNWIGPAGRVLLGCLAGFAALAAGDRIFKKGQRTYAQGITGLGIAVLYLSFYASFGFYHLLQPAMAFLLMVMTTAMAGALAIRYDAAQIAMLGLLGGYMTPVLLSTGEDRPWVFFSYVLLLNIGAIAVSRAKGWLRLEAIAFVATVALYGGWFADRFRPEKHVVAGVFAAAFYALFAISGQRWVFLLVQALAALVMSQIWAQVTAPFFGSTLTLLLAGLAVTDRRGWAFGASVTGAAFWVAYFLWMSDLAQAAPAGAVLLALTAAFLALLGWLPWRLVIRKAALVRQDLLVAAASGAVYYGFCYDLLQADHQAYLGLLAAAVGGVYLAVGMLLWNSLPEQARDKRPVLLVIGVALAFLTLAIPVQFAGFRITMAWSVEAAALAWIGVRTDSLRLRLSALAVLVLVLGRLATIDSWMYSMPSSYRGLWNARFLTFVAAAASFWACAWWTRKGAPALAAYLGGHLVMLWNLGLEVHGWAARTVSAVNLTSAESAAMSVLIAAYALLLVAVGVVSRSVVNRLMGLALIAFVVLKLYLYDVWLLGRLYRILAFGGLGGLLLGTSYLYSRYRGSIENWWKDEAARS